MIDKNEIQRTYRGMDSRTDSKRLEWLAKNTAVAFKISQWGLWCIDFSYGGGKDWCDYSKDECTTTMREAIDLAMDA